MAVTFKIKRRASNGSSGSPTSLASGELAYNEVASDNTLYYGYGDNGSGVATSVVAIAGAGAYATLSGNQTINGDKIFTGTLTFCKRFCRGSASRSRTAPRKAFSDRHSGSARKSAKTAAFRSSPSSTSVGVPLPAVCARQLS